MDRKYLDAGQIVSSHGIRGEIKILPWADSPEFLLDFDTVYIDGKPFAVENSRVQKTCVLMKLKDVDTVEAATLLRTKVVRIDRTNVEPEDGAVFIADLIGCRCIDEGGNEFGILKDVLTMPSSDVYEIRGEHEYLIPAVKEFVKEINVNERFVKIHLIEGFRTDEN
ncbi:MAG: ribosome maturation factor RimM [Clostridia bacterium]|nr:ribosome maturation factor RimM [Clostridia bacterium]